MKNKKPIVVWLALALLPCLIANAAEGLSAAAVPATASITGRVQNIGTGQYLQNVRVTVSGTTIGALTDEIGSYTISGLPVGEVELTASYVGLMPRTQSVKTKGGESATVNFEMLRQNREVSGSEGVVKLYLPP